MQPESNDLPEFLRSVDAFTTHLQDLFVDSNNDEKGDRFLDFALRLLPLMDLWTGFDPPRRSEKKTHDKGIDFSADSASGARAFGQSKYRIREVKDFESVISKFAVFEHQAPFTKGTQGDLIVASAPSTSHRFVLLTSSDLSRITEIYEKAPYPSAAAWQRWRANDQFVIIDGPKILQELQSLYRQSFIIAPEVELETASGYLSCNNVYITTVTAKALARIYEVHGSSLFFENIREFLGANGDEGGRGSVNDEIIHTLSRAPSQMLGRNNGITFRASSVEVISDRRIKMKQCNIVNGCQTTMCVARAAAASEEAQILVKVVTGIDAWEVAKAANYQNSVTRVELELARFLRPQLVRKAATDMGYGVLRAAQPSVSDVLEAIHVQRVEYDALRFFYLGIFSRFPQNIFKANYADLRIDLLERFYTPQQEEHLLRVLFRLVQAMKGALIAAEQKFQGKSHLGTFKRFFDDDKVQYACLLGLLTASACVKDNLVQKDLDTTRAYERLREWIRRLEVVLETHAAYFERVFRFAFMVIADRVMLKTTEGREEIQQSMYKEVNTASGPSFSMLYEQLMMRVDNDETLTGMQPEFRDERAEGST